MPSPIHTVVMYPRPHPDPIAALFLLQEYGREKYPGIDEVNMEFWNQLPEGKTVESLEQEGILLIDVGKGKFDHHAADGEKITTTELVARDLGITNDPVLKKLIAFIRRDDIEGKGTLSQDPLDRAFGLSATVMNLNRDFVGHHETVVSVVLTIIAAHIHEQRRRLEEIPQEWEKLQAEGKTETFFVGEGKEKVKVVVVQHDHPGLVGFLRARSTIHADIVVQVLSSGHVNIVTRQDKKIDLRGVIALLRREEARRRNVELSVSWERLVSPERIEMVPNWYFDTAANTLQNGTAHSAGWEPTVIPLDLIKKAIKGGLNAQLIADFEQKYRAATA